MKGRQGRETPRYAYGCLAVAILAVVVAGALAVVVAGTFAVVFLWDVNAR